MSYARCVVLVSPVSSKETGIPIAFLLSLIHTRFNSAIMLQNIRTSILGAIVLTLVAAGCKNNSTSPTVVAPSQGFLVTPLAANKASSGAVNTDTNLQDAWGLAFNVTYGFPWVADRASGLTTIYDTTGALKNHYYINGPGGVKGSPTGVVQNTVANSFFVPGAGTNATWIFSQLNGTIAAIAGGAVDSSFILADRSTSSSFTGLALVTMPTGATVLYAPNVKNASLDQFDQNYNRVQFSAGFQNGYTPFNVVQIETQLFVTEAKSSGTFPYFAVGAGNGGSVDLFSLGGTYEKTLVSGGSLDQPWGLAIAPASFGSYAGKLLVGNFGDGTIHVYDRTSGAMVGTLSDVSGNPITIPGLWALVVYNGTLYYTAGPNGGTDGILGKITLR